MTSNWAAFAIAEPAFAKTVEERFAQHVHHVLATLRKDGSPRTSGLEVHFPDGELRLAMMPDSLKARDLLRDPRFSLMANPGEGTTLGGGDVRISGRAVPVEDPEATAFRVELTEVTRTFVEDDKYLVVQVWNPGGGPVRTMKRT
ncbi:pyridoxamine 5'-phosphate oxidase family protein [Streptomyces sp. NPDC050145]|uniref:pyridoxamine 5'-phosphate oxidase family protein n=1 Tax=Streptomyces sp. NPDC050145 TaxID=3365602 RepID=UPI003794AAA5